ncbi:MAG: GerMN domain-containing protein, partial [Clostridia bacterium]
ITIYFPDENAEYLVPEYREIEVQASLSVEKLVLSELMKGPEDKTLTQVIPSDVKVIGTETKDGVCFVNLSGEFVEKIPSSSSSTTMALYSIVNSLTELDTIDSVQILINGKTGVELGNYVLDVPLEKNTSLIKE